MRPPPAWPLALLLAAACTSPTPHLPAPTHAPTSSLATLGEIEQLVALHFYSPTRLDAEWRTALDHARTALSQPTTDAQLSAELNAALSVLGASHTEFRTRAEPRAWELADVFWESLPREARERAFGETPVLAGIGILTDDESDGHVIRAVLDGSPAARVGLARGDRLLSCEGQPFHPVRSFAGRAGEPLQLALRTSDGRTGEVVVEPDLLRPRERYLAALRASARIHARGGRQLASVHAWSWAGEEFTAALHELFLEGPLAGADGLVLDLRDGLGGANPDAFALFSRELPVLVFGDRKGARTVLASAWRAPMALLVDGGTSSGKEILAHAFQRARRGPVVGTRTAGAVLGGSLFLLRDGSVLYLAVRDVTVDGVRLEGHGVEPDVQAAPTDERGRDVPLEHALDALLHELRSPRAASRSPLAGQAGHG